MSLLRQSDGANRERASRALLLVLPLLVVAGLLRPQGTGGVATSSKILGPAIYDIVIVGDSRTSQGISPAAMSVVLGGRRAMNLGYNGVCLNRAYLTAASKRLDPSRPGRTLVIAVSPYALTPRADRESSFKADAEVREALRWVDTYASPIAAFFAPYELPGPPRMATVTRFQDGWEAQQTAEDKPLASQLHYRDNFDGNQVSSGIVDELLETVAELRAAGILIVAFRMPAYPALQALEDSLSGYDDASLSIKFRGAGARWLEFESERYRYYDGTHMPSEAAREFSRDLAEAMRRAAP